MVAPDRIAQHLAGADADEIGDQPMEEPGRRWDGCPMSPGPGTPPMHSAIPSFIYGEKPSVVVDVASFRSLSFFSPHKHTNHSF